MEIREYTGGRREEILRLYRDAGWTAYTENAEALLQGFAHSLLVLTADEGGELLGVVRLVGDGFTVVLVQDVLVSSTRRRQGIGTALLRAALARFPGVRQVLLITDDTPETAAFYESAGFAGLDRFGCRGFMKG